MCKYNRTTKTSQRRPELLGCVSLLAILIAIEGARAQDITPVPPVSVIAPSIPLTQPLDGSAAAGYRVQDSTASGPIWGDLPVQDTPYSISVIPAPLIENLQAYNPEDVFNIIPQITNLQPTQNRAGFSIVYIRGFGVSQAVNGAGGSYDGLLNAGGNAVLEDKERVEVLSGVNSFLYGTGSVGGNINYALKRPTDAPYYSLTFGDNAGRNGYVHGDFGGPLNIPGIDPGIFAYRLNIVGQDGNTSIENQTLKRDLISGALDIHLPYDILLQLNASHADNHVWGVTPGFSSKLNPFPAAPNPANVFYPSWTQTIYQTDNAGARVTWKLNDVFTVRAAYDYTRVLSPPASGALGINEYKITSYQGNATTYVSDSQETSTVYTNSGYAFLDSTFSTFGVENKVTAGFTGFTTRTAGSGITSCCFSTSYSNNVYNLQNTPAPTLSYSNITPFETKGFAKNYIIGDEIKINNQFTILAGGNYTVLGTQNFVNASSDYDKAALTPTVSLIYKVLPWLTTYATYQQSLQPGTEVPITGSQHFTNAGAILPPYTGNQYEVGAKATVGTNLLLTAALFDISKENIYTIANPNGTYTELAGGSEVHKGVELTATGKIIDDLTIVGGVTMMDARVESDPASPTINGNIPQGVSPFSEKIYAEYNMSHIPNAPWLQGLTLIAGWRWSSAYYQSEPNASGAKLPGYSVADLGFRYETKLYDHPFILRFNVNNIANTGYWQTIYYEGAPRTFLATAEMKW